MRKHSMDFLAAFAALILCGCATTTKGLGNGYHLVYRAEDVRGVPGAFEGAAHYSDLYYRDQRLGTVGEHSIAPSGRFALFEESGKLMLFNQQTHTLREVTDGAFAIPRSFTWNEANDVVDVIYFDNHAPSRIALNSGN